MKRRLADMQGPYGPIVWDRFGVADRYNGDREIADRFAREHAVDLEHTERDNLGETE